MVIRSSVFFITALSAGFISLTSAIAQEVGRNPSVTHLMQSYGIDQVEAQKRIDVQSEIIALSERLNADNDPAFGDMYIQHEPVFKIIILFADNSDRKAFLDSLSPSLRRYVQLKSAKKSRGAVTRELEELATTLERLTVPFTSKYDLASEQFVITAETQATVDLIRAALPAARKVETVFKVAPVPKPQSAPIGVQTGDGARGGEAVWIGTGGSASGSWCTLGYAVNYTEGGVAKKGILTAGHCYDTMYLNFGSRDVTLSGPFIDKPHKSGFPTIEADGLSDKYDFQIWDATGLSVSNTISYVNKNSIPEFASNGTLRLTGITSFVNQKAGMVVCKSGVTTGITCGEITNGNSYRDGVYGWIEVSKTKQRLISDGGDSGGPWFLYPGTSTAITGVGIHSAGDAVPGPTGIAQYMPIDYIDDQNSSVNTIKQ
jgi:hypothetical protein